MSAATLTRVSSGEYVTPDGAWRILRTSADDDWYGHRSDRPWAVLRMFYSGAQVEARFTTLAAARRWLGA